jgi:HEAT repeat protein
MLSNLLDLSQSTSSDTRCFAANRLGTISEEAAQIRLRQMLTDPHKQVRRAAERASQKFASANQDVTNE